MHNAAAGYWSIATGSMTESNVLCAFDASFGAGLLEALTQLAVRPAIPCCWSPTTPNIPPPLHAKRPIPDALRRRHAADAASKPQLRWPVSR